MAPPPPAPSSAAVAVTATATVRTASGQRIAVKLPGELTVSELKGQLVEATGIPTRSQRLVFNGRILTPDDSLVSSFGVTAGSSLNLVRAASNSQSVDSTTASVAALPGSASAQLASGMSPEAIASMMENPLVSSLLGNPEFMRSIIQSDPRMQSMVENNPEMARMLESESFIQQMSVMMRNPRLMQEQMRTSDRALANLESIPGGFNYLSSMYGSIQGSMNAAREEDPSTDERNRMVAEQLGANRRHTASTSPNADALPNPWARQPSQPSASPLAANPMGSMPAELSSLFGQSNSIASPSPQERTSSAAPREYNPVLFNPFMSSNTNNLQSLLQGFPGQFAPATPTMPSIPIPVQQQQQQQPVRSINNHANRERWATELQTLREMGLVDNDTSEEKAIRALFMAAGDIEATVEVLFGMN